MSDERKEAEHPLARWLALNRTVGVVLLTVLCFGLGEQLWSQFMPAYLDARTKQLARDAAAVGEVPWASLFAVGLYACLLNFFEGFCYIGGGQLTARLGDRGSLLLFAVLTLAGYVIFLTVPSAWAAVAAAILILGWEPLSVPVTFTTVGSTVESSRQGLAFAVQSIQKRLPKIIGPLIAGFVLAYWEEILGSRDEARVAGLRTLVSAALVLGLISLAIQVRWMPHRKPSSTRMPSLQVLAGFHPALRRLLVAEVFARWCDWLVREFAVLYLLLVRGVPVQQIGMLIALQNLVALATYLPIGRLTQTVGTQPFIGLTFVFFALFPLTLALVPDSLMWVAYVVYGLREIGEPARKATITMLLPEPVRAQGVGLYWGVRSFALCPAALGGALVWQAFGPQVLLYTAFASGCVATAAFYLLFRVPAEPRTET